MQQSQRYRKVNIPAAVRRTVWNTYIGEDIGRTECYVGCKNKITQLTFECGHIEAESKGGLTIVENLRPICSPCNRSMGTRNMHEFMKTFGFKCDIVENKDIIDDKDIINDNYKCNINKPRREMTHCEPINYFIENCIEYKKGKKILFDDMYQLFDGFCPAFCDKEKVKSISKDMFIKYFIDNFYEVDNGMLHGYKFKYEDDTEDDENKENEENDENKENEDFYDMDDMDDSDIIEYYKL
jgi:hypothetical protein